MSGVRQGSVRMKHRSRKRPFRHRAAELASKGDKTPIISGFAEAYQGDPKRAELAEQMKEMACKAMEEQNGDLADAGYNIFDDPQPLTEETQPDIIKKVIGQKGGTYITETGNAYRRPPLPRGGPQNSQLKELLQKKDEELLQKKDEELRKRDDSLSR